MTALSNVEADSGKMSRICGFLGIHASTRIPYFLYIKKGPE